jgi:ABC-type branched-subunit amino acid transport system substrate-binding protein
VKVLCGRSVRILFCLILAICGCFNDGRESTHRGKLIVAVVGDGVPPLNKTVERRFPLNRSQSRAMYVGVRAALERSPRLKGLTDIVEVLGRDDASSGDLARDIAKELRTKNVIAVIGHATSETTYQAAGVYAPAGIPLLMPIATSPRVMFPNEKEARISNAFRLPPADDRSQAPAISRLIKDLKTVKLFVIQDISEGAQVYSSSLFGALRPLVSGLPMRIGEADRELTDFSRLAASIRAEKSDTVVFCGYGSTVIELMNELRKTYQDVEFPARPKVVLTDGCHVPDLDTSGFDVYLTFPHIALRQPANKIDKDNIRIVTDTFGDPGKLNYELFGFDAMLILGDAINACLAKDGVTRKCIIDELNRPVGFTGIAGNYEFHEGENRLSSYDILSGSPADSTVFAPTERRVVTWEELITEVRGAAQN